MLYNWTCRANRGGLLSNRYSHLQLHHHWPVLDSCVWIMKSGDGAYKQANAICEVHQSIIAYVLQRQISSADQSIVHALKPFHSGNCGLLISGPAGLIKFRETSSCAVLPLHPLVTPNGCVTLNVPVNQPPLGWTFLFFFLNKTF